MRQTIVGEVHLRHLHPGDPLNRLLPLSHPDMRLPHQEQLRRLISELKIPDLEPIRQKEILEQMQRLLDEPD